MRKYTFLIHLKCFKQIHFLTPLDIDTTYLFCDRITDIFLLCCTFPVKYIFWDLLWNYSADKPRFILTFLDRNLWTLLYRDIKTLNLWHFITLEFWSLLKFKVKVDSKVSAVKGNTKLGQTVNFLTLISQQIQVGNLERWDFVDSFMANNTRIMRQHEGMFIEWGKAAMTHNVVHIS